MKTSPVNFCLDFSHSKMPSNGLPSHTVWCGGVTTESHVATCWKAARLLRTALCTVCLQVCCKHDQVCSCGLRASSLLKAKQVFKDQLLLVVTLDPQNHYFTSFFKFCQQPHVNYIQLLILVLFYGDCYDMIMMRKQTKSLLELSKD